MEQLNPFDDPQQGCHVLINAQGQHSLWPDFCDVPPGWTIVHGPASRQDCGQWLEDNWRDPRPASLRRALGADVS